ncbi:MAG: Ig-like domain-containing protein [Bacteroidota bacterium]
MKFRFLPLFLITWVLFNFMGSSYGKGNPNPAKPEALIVEIISPNITNGTIYVEGDEFFFTARLDGTNPEIAQVAKIDFFNGTELIFSDSDIVTGVAEFKYQNIPAGDLNLKVVAYNAAGAALAEDNLLVPVRALPRVEIISPADGTVLIQDEPVLLRIRATDADGSITKVIIKDGFLKLDSVLTPTSGNIYEYTLPPVQSGAYEIQAVAFDNDGYSVESNIVNLSAYDIEIISPDTENGAVYVEGGQFFFTASLTGPNAIIGQITRVEFFDGNALLFTDDQIEFATAEFIYANIPSGDRILRAVAWNGPTKLVEDVKIVNVRAIPQVEILAPSDKSVFVENDPVTVRMRATDADGTISKIRIIESGFFARDSVSTPVSGGDIYEYVYSEIAPGDYQIMAEAVDDEGYTTQSNTINITVLDQPKVTINTPTSQDDLIEGQTIVFSASVFDIDSEIDTVRFFAGDSLIEEIVNPDNFGIIWENIPPGSFDLRVEVIDDTGLKNSSPSVPIVIKAKPVFEIISPPLSEEFEAAPIYIEGDTIPFIIRAKDPDGVLDSVVLSLLDTTLARIVDRVPGSEGFSTFRHDWISNKSGFRQFIVSAWDNDNLFRSSPFYKLRIQARPEVKIIFPFNNSQYGLGNNIFIQVDALDRDNEIVDIKFFHKNAIEGRDTLISIDDDVEEGGWGTVWKKPPLGNHVIYAKAEDETGLTKNSGDIFLSIFPPTNASYFSFEAQQLPSGVQLNWETDQLYRIKSFFVERSVDGLLYEAITKSKIEIPQGTTTDLQSYTYTDLWDDIPNSDELYYRIKGAGIDGFSSYSQVDTVYRGQDFTVEVFPVPASQNGSLRVVIGGEAEMLEFRDVTGRLVLTREVQPDDKVIFFPSGTLPRGLYFLTVKTELPELGRNKMYEITKKIYIHGDF